MAIIKNPITVVGGGGGDVVNGIIEQYKASAGTIDANTFVEFVGHWNESPSAGNPTNVTSLSMEEATGSKPLSAVTIDKNKVVLFRRYNKNLYATVCGISNETINAGASTLIASSLPPNNGGFQCAKISSNEVFVAFNEVEGSSIKYVTCVVCKISGNTISLGATKKISNTYAMTPAVAAIDEDVVMLVQRTSTTRTIGTICTVVGNNILTGADTFLGAGVWDDGICATLVSDDTVLVVIPGYASSTEYYYGIACQISGTTITVGSVTLLGNRADGYNSDGNAIIEVRNGVAFFMYEESNSMRGKICEIDGTTITVGATNTIAQSAESSGRYAVWLGDGHFLVTYEGSGMTLRARVCSVSDTDVLVGAEMTVPTTSAYRPGGLTSVAAIGLGRTLIFYLNVASDYSTFFISAMTYCWPSPGVKTSDSKIEGLTKTACTTSTAGDVWVLNN